MGNGMGEGRQRRRHDADKQNGNIGPYLTPGLRRPVEPAPRHQIDRPRMLR
jgi:hypothetical protein